MDEYIDFRMRKWKMKNIEKSASLRISGMKIKKGKIERRIFLRARDKILPRQLVRRLFAQKKLDSDLSLS